MSKHKAGGSKASQHVNPAGKRLGVKIADGQAVAPGMVMVRQRGTLVGAGRNVGVGRDHSLFALATGKAKFLTRSGKKVLSVV